MSSHSGKAAQVTRGTLVGQQGRVGQVFLQNKNPRSTNKKKGFGFSVELYYIIYLLYYMYYALLHY